MPPARTSFWIGIAIVTLTALVSVARAHTAEQLQQGGSDVAPASSIPYPGRSVYRGPQWKF
jgi:hypothetical protein